MFTIFEHFEELKYRSIYVLLSFIIYFVLFYCYAPELLYFIIKPLLILSGLDQFIYTNLMDVFFVYFKLGMYFSLLLTVIIVLYNIITFLSPGLYIDELKQLIKGILLGLSFFLILLNIFYFLFIPLIWSFFLTNTHSFCEIVKLVFEARVTEYVSLVFQFLGFFFVFIQLPLYILIYIYIKFINYNIYKQYRLLFFSLTLLYVLLFAPPDITIQFIILISIFVGFEFIILLVHILHGYYNFIKNIGY